MASEIRIENTLLKAFYNLLLHGLIVILRPRWNLRKQMIEFVQTIVGTINHLLQKFMIDFFGTAYFVILKTLRSFIATLL